MAAGTFVEQWRGQVLSVDVIDGHEKLEGALQRNLLEVGV